MTTTLRDLLNDGKVHVLDGAMGTMLYSKGFFLNVCYDELNLKQPKLVREVHEAYVRAGAKTIGPTPSGANPANLRGTDLPGAPEKSNRRPPQWPIQGRPGAPSAVAPPGPP